MRLKVHCKHYKEDCEWNGELVALDVHLAHDCQYRKLKCPYGCPENISFCDLEVHKSDECNLRPAEKKADTNSRKIEELTQEIRLWKQKLKVQCKNQQECENWIRMSWCFFNSATCHYWLVYERSTRSVLYCMHSLFVIYFINFCRKL